MRRALVLLALTACMDRSPFQIPVYHLAEAHSTVAAMAVEGRTLFFGYTDFFRKKTLVASVGFEGEEYRELVRIPDSGTSDEDRLSLRRLAVTPDHVYYLMENANREDDAGYIGRVARNGGAEPEVFAGNLRNADGLVVHSDGAVYWGAFVQGSFPSACGTCDSFTIFREGTQDQTRRQALHGSHPHGEGPIVVLDSVGQGPMVFWVARSNQAELWRQPARDLASNVAVAIDRTSNPARGAGIAANTEEIYWGTQSAIHVTPRAMQATGSQDPGELGGGNDGMYRGASDVGPLAIDPIYVYWIDGGSTLFRTRRDGSGQPQTILEAGSGDLGAFVLGADGRIYFGGNGDKAGVFAIDLPD